MNGFTENTLSRETFARTCWAIQKPGNTTACKVAKWVITAILIVTIVTPLFDLLCLVYKSYFSQCTVKPPSPPTITPESKPETAAPAANADPAAVALRPREEATTCNDRQTILEQLTEEQRGALQPFLGHQTASPDDVLDRLLLLWTTPAAALAMNNVDWSQLPKIDVAADQFLPLSDFRPSSIPQDPAEYPAFFERHNLAPSATSARPPGSPLNAGQDLAALLRNCHPRRIRSINESEETICIRIERSDGTTDEIEIQPNLNIRVDYNENIISLSILNATTKEPLNEHFFSTTTLEGDIVYLYINKTKPQGLHFHCPTITSAESSSAAAAHATSSMRSPETSPSTGSKIPPLFFMIWLGKPFPSKYYENILSFKRLNPDHTVILWTDCTATDIASHADAEEMRRFCAEHDIKLVNYDMAIPLLQKHGLTDIFATYIAQRQFGAMSDLLRIVLMYEFGGTYADADRTCYRPLSRLRDNQLVLPSSRMGKSDGPHSNDFLMSVQRHSIWSEMMYACRERHINRCPTASLMNFTRKDAAVIENTGPELLLQTYKKHVQAGQDTSGIVILAPPEIDPYGLRNPRSFSHGLIAADWKEASARMQSFIIDRRESRTQRISRLAFCILEDLRIYGEIFWGCYTKYFDADPLLRAEVEAEIARVYTLRDA